MNKTYTGSDIQVLQGLEPVRKRPGMYIGSTDSRGLHHLVWEILDNSIDEAMAGFGSVINVTLTKQHEIIIEDEGRGVPVDMHPTGRNTLEVIFSTLHAGGKFEEGAYKVSGGLHGVGSSVVNALSEYLTIEVKKDKKIHRLEFSEGGSKVSNLEVIGNTRKTGTKVTFKPDKAIFKTVEFNADIIKNRLKQSAFLLKNLTINFQDENTESEESFCYENGIMDFVNEISLGMPQVHDSQFFDGQEASIEIEFAFKFTKEDDEVHYSYVNNIRTIDGGSHELGFKNAFTKCINEFARKVGLLKTNEKDLEGNDIRAGLVWIISTRIPEKLLEFEGQTKGKLGTPEAKQAVEKVVYDNLAMFLTSNEVIAKSIIDRAVLERKAREAAKKARIDAKTSKELSKKKDLVFGGKLTPAISKDVKQNELYLVEGDSAGGSAKQGRDKYHQAILPLRGKVINSEKAKLSDIVKNEEIKTMISAIGTGIGTEFNLKNLNYDKIIIMTDADQDGAHIQTLILAFFYRFMTELIEAGKIYIALPPLYKITSNKSTIKYAWTNDELDKMTAKMSNYMLQRYKGLGEMNADQLWETTMNPETRTLIKVTLADLEKSEEILVTLMGDKSEPRKRWLEEHIEF